MQPAQLILLDDQIPVPAPVVLAELPETDVGRAITLLGALIARASGIGTAAASMAEVGDE